MKFENEHWTISATSWVVHDNHRNKFKMATAAIVKIFAEYAPILTKFSEC